ncbi:MAG TPA: alpha/beta fold hydrolase [Acidimicrobiales bacterium]|nr:alpha/beta fold hydrolase [Acidimicrobiales bacterium]
MSEILPGAEPWSAPGGPAGVLVLHGFTGSPQSMRPLAEAFAAAGFTVEMPLLPGHGTSVDDMLTTSWADWSTAAEAAYAELAHRCESVVVAGLSMGGTLTLWLAERHPAIAGIVCVNPAVGDPEGTPQMIAGLTAMVDAGETTMDAIGADIALEGATELAYDRTPIAPLITLMEATAEVRDGLGHITCPLLLCTSPDDHVVPPADSDRIAAGVDGPVERVTLERSFHVATLDHDAGLIEEHAVAFARRVTA